MGFLPGDVKEKMDPYMQPLFDNLTVIKHRFSAQSPEFIRINDMIKDEKLVITPLAYIRGRSLSNIFFIVDEAQNLTAKQVYDPAKQGNDKAPAGRPPARLPRRTRRKQQDLRIRFARPSGDVHTARRELQ